MGFLRSKRGAIEVSVNTIIILIFAIAILGLGLTFVRKSMGSATNQFGQVTEQMRTDMMNTLKESGAKLTINPTRITLSKASAAQMTGEIFYAIRNFDTTQAAQYKINTITCVAIDGSTGAPSAKTYSTLTISAGSSDVQPIKVTATPATPSTSYKCTLNVDNNDNTVYAFQNFFVDVTD